MIGRKKEKVKINPVAAMAAGVIIGAGAAAAGAAVLKDKKNREQVKKVMNEVKSHVTGYMDDMQHAADKKEKEGKQKLDEGKKELKK